LVTRASLFSSIIIWKKKKKFNYAVIATEGIVEREDGKILISRRARNPQKERWGFNGTYVTASADSLEILVKDHIKKETGLETEITHLMDVVDGPWLKHSYEDTTVHIVQVVYRAKYISGEPISTEHADLHEWVHPQMLRLKRIAFNHKEILKRYLKRKKDNTCISVDRSKYTEHYGKEYPYHNRDHTYVVVKSIILNEKNEILLAHRAQDPYIGSWDFPGGRMKSFETVHECLQREITEELGVKSTVGNLFHVYSDKGANPKFARVMPLYFTKIHSTVFNKNIEMDDFAWFPLDALPEKLAYHIDKPLADIKAYLEI
jgi:8-oxo-dGTP diphosphatase